LVGAAFGVDNGAVLTIMEILQRTNARSRDGALWDLNENGLNTAENVLRAQALELFTSINST
jgi:hypothetical protein